MLSKEILHQNKKLHYKISGSGTPVVLIHGFAEDHSIWEHQIHRLSNQFKIIALDLPGSGFSESLDNENLSIEDLANAVDEVIEAEQLDSIMLIGHSMGGYITLAYEKMFPHKTKSIGLFHSTAFADNEIKIQNRKKAIDFIKSNGSEPFLKTIIPDLYFDKTKEKVNIEKHLSIANKIAPSVLIQYYKAMINRNDSTAILKNLKKPALLIGGTHDLLIPFKQTITESCYPECASVSILKNSAHMGMIEQHENANKIISAFIHFTHA